MIARPPGHIGKAPAELDGMLAGAAADLQHVAAASRLQAREHREDRPVIAVEGGPVETTVGCRRRRTALAEFSDVLRQDSLVVDHEQPYRAARSDSREDGCSSWRPTNE